MMPGDGLSCRKRLDSVFGAGLSRLLVDARPILRPGEGMTNAPESDLFGDLDALMPEALDWLRQMVSINSFTANREGVNRTGSLTAECFRDLGFTPEFVPSDNKEHGSHLFLSSGDASRRPVVLVTHLDTVFPPEEEERNDFRWFAAADKGRIYGPGTVDIKGGTVLIWMLLKILKQRHPALFEANRWLVAANASEEVIGAEFGRRTAERAPDGARAVLVFEGGPREGNRYHLVTARKGRAVYRLRAEGRSAHAGSSHAAGANAIVTLAGAIQAAARLTDYPRDLTVNVGSVSGGSVVNRVPQEASAELEMRAFDPLILEEGQRRIEALARRAQQPSEAHLEVACTGTSPAWPLTEEALTLAGHWRDAAQELGIGVINVSRGGLSDANYLCGLGPTLDGLGPSGANAHCSERSHDGSKVPEYVEPGSFVPKTALDLKALCGLLRVNA